ncbi:hypothetical protein J3R82DRAFT_3290 [Butyriboletus roseoflavus]|nr:hypothetical protein J3R82DRAFT_3290 [Butyriboletus roseoflavus]
MLQAIFESTTGVHPPCFILELPSELHVRIFENLSVKDIRRCVQDTFNFVKVDSTTLDTYDIRHDKPPRVFFADGWLGATYRARGKFAARLIDCNATTPSQSLRTWARETLNPTQPFLFPERPILDVWQDLLVLTETLIRSLHAEPWYPLGFPHGGVSGVEPAESKFEVNGNFVAMLKSDHGYRVGFFSLLQVWNWKEGRTTSILERHDKQPYLDDFCFLDSDRLLVLSVPGSCIAVYSYADFDKPLHLQARFMLTVCMPRSTHLHTSPFPDSVYTQGGGSRGPTFVPSLEGRISVLAATDPGRLLVIWNDIFLPHVPPFPDIQQDKDGVYIVAWNTWGPANTRALTVCGPATAPL